MKIAIISSEYPPFGGGIGTYVSRLSHGLSKKKHSVIVLTRNNHHLGKDEIIHDGDIEVHRIKFLPIFPFGNRLISSRIEQIVKTIDPDIINVQYPAPMQIRSNAPIILTIHNALAGNLEEFSRGSGIPSTVRMISPLLLRYEKRCISHYDNLASVSEIVADQISKAYEIPPSRIRLIGNGIDVERFTPDQSNGSGKYILYSGRIDRTKRVDLLIRAFGDIQQRNPGNRLTIVGRGPLESNLKTLAKRLGIEDSVEFRGWLTGDQYVEALRGAMIYVLPSSAEGLSTTLLEAMSVGLPAIASDIPNNRAIIKDTVEGILFKCGDYKDLADRLAELLSDPGMRGRMGRNARKTCISRFDWKGVIDRFEALAEELAFENERQNDKSLPCDLNS